MGLFDHTAGEISERFAKGQCSGHMTRCLGICDKKSRPSKFTCWHHMEQEYKLRCKALKGTTSA